MKNLKYLICFIMGVLLTISINIVGASIESSGIMYNSKSLNTVLDDLYSKINEINNTGDATAKQILSGKTALVKGEKVTGTMPDRGTNQTTEGFGCFPSGCGSGDSQYYAFKDIPEGYYHKDGYSWAPEIRVNANKFRSALGISAAKIASGQSIAGITGTYTSDATASTSNILSGKTAYVKGSKLTGTHTSLNHTYSVKYHNFTQLGSGQTCSFSYSFTPTVNGKLIVFMTATRNQSGVSSAWSKRNVTVNGSTVTPNLNDANDWAGRAYWVTNVSAKQAVSVSTSISGTGTSLTSCSLFVLYVQ